jgi:hypothetical protein
MSREGTHLALLTVTVTASVADVAASMQEALDANSEMTSPSDPTDQLQPGLAIGAAVRNQSGLLGVLERLDGFMKLADLAAEVRLCRSAARSDRVTDNTWTANIGPSVGKARVGSRISGIYGEFLDRGMANIRFE